MGKLFNKFFVNILMVISMVEGCVRKPKGATGERSPVDDSFQILIDGNPQTYIPGQQYNVSLSCSSGVKFISFTLIVETESGVTAPLGYDMLGHFELLDVAETKFSMSCENMVESTNTNTKSRVDVAWVAPTNPDSGCVILKAAIVQHRNVWFIDDGFLTKRLCPEEIDEVNSQTPPVNPCCACDEAKYEIVLERRWTRNTHAKDFPSEAWRTRLSEIIGASHTRDYRFWEYGSKASQGLKEMAEHGATQNLEAEIKANINSGSIRTIIKAPGIVYKQNTFGSTLANVRVDPQHHMISLVSKIYPSPDWILGVAGLELCLMNCTWVERKVLNLYPWDIGTDSGPSYMSPDQPQVPPDVIRRITSTFPSDYRSPFYDDTGAPMKPIGVLYITRRKLYERVCDVDENIPVECAVHPWNNWSECSTRCGPGTQYRQRAYKDERLALNFRCQMELQQQQDCMGEQCGLPGESVSPNYSSAECDLGSWSPWSACSNRCGKGTTIRTRDFKNPYAREKCQRALNLEMEQSQECYGNDCGGSIRTNQDSYGSFRRPLVDEFGEPGVMGENYYSNQFSAQDNSNNRRFPAETFNTKPRGNVAVTKFGTRPSFSKSGLEGSVPQENIYGSEQLVGEPINRANKFESIGPSRNTEGQELFGSIDERDMRKPSFYPNRFSKDPLETFGNGFESFSTTRSPFGGPLGNDFSSASYPGNLQPPNSLGGDLTQDFDNGYSVVQEYCFQKPVASGEPCRLRKVIISNYWFYDAEDQECKIFTADNCDENKNKFRTLEACEGTCHKPQMNAKNWDEPEDNWDSGFGAPMSQTRFQSRKTFRNFN